MNPCAPGARKVAAAMANLHNIVSDLFVHLGIEGNDVVYKWTRMQDSNNVNELTFRLNDAFYQNLPLYIRRPNGKCVIQISALPDQNFFVAENTLFKGHDLARLMQFLVEHDIALGE
jgi:hypothetical protein